MMKRLFFLCSIFFIVKYSAFGQYVCTNIKVESPVASKPTNVQVSASCSDFTLQWQEDIGGPGQSYIVSIFFVDSLNPSQIDTVSSPLLFGANSATFSVNPSMVVSWSIQGIKDIDSRTFYSYPLRSTEEYIIPTCVSSSVVAERSIYAEASGSPLFTMEERKVKVDSYPNPVHSILNLNVSSVAKGFETAKAIIKVVDISGKVVLTQKAIYGTLQLNVSKLSNGAYFIRIEEASGKLLYIAKFLKE